MARRIKNVSGSPLNIAGGLIAPNEEKEVTDWFADAMIKKGYCEEVGAKKEQEVSLPEDPEVPAKTQKTSKKKAPSKTDTGK